MAAIRDFILRQTCGACPEAYDVYRGDLYVGSLRLRHGYFSATYNGDVVYSATPKGDGIFESDERAKYLNAGCLAIKDALARKSDRDKAGLIFEFGEIADD